MNDWISMLAGAGTDDPQALAAALRKQEILGLLGQLSGDRVLAPVGRSVGALAENRREEMVKGPRELLKMAMEAQKAGGLEEYRRGQQTLGKERLAEQRDMGTERLRAQAANAEARRQERASAAEVRVSEKESQLTDKQFVELGKAANLARGRQGVAGEAMRTIQQAKRDLQLIAQNPNPNEQQLYEIARGLDRVISGAVPTIGATEHLVPQTLRGRIASFEQWLRNKPTGAEKQEFVKQYKETLERIEAATRTFVNDTNAQTFNAYSHLATKDRKRWDSAIHAAGLSPDDFDPETWLYKGREGTPETAPEKALEWDPATGTWKE